MASNKHAQIRYKVLDDCFSNFRRKFYFDDLLQRCNEALRELYGDNYSGIKTRTLRSDISYMRDRAGESGVEIDVLEDGNGYFYRYSESDFSIISFLLRLLTSQSKSARLPIRPMLAKREKSRSHRTLSI